MSVLIRRSYVKAKNNLLLSNNSNISVPCTSVLPRNFSDEKFGDGPRFSSSTILVESGLNVQELPVIVRKLKSLSDIEEKPVSESERAPQDSVSYNLIQDEFKQCLDLREVFSLISKCTKISPNIALGAMERIYELEKNPSNLPADPSSMHVNVAKGAILDKLLKVVMKTEDTQTILNILQMEFSFMEPYKYTFSEELLFRVIDNKLTIKQLCDFVMFLSRNKNDTKYFEIVDKLWVGFVEQENDINETNIGQVFTTLHAFKASKRTILTLLEDKLYDLWPKINVSVMQEVLNIFIQEKYLSMQSFAVVGQWLKTNIHVVDEDSLLDIISKLTRLNYTDDQIERSVEKYVKLRGPKIEAHVFIVGILNYCMQFQLSNKQILQSCSEFIVKNGHTVPSSFIKSLIYPLGYLYFNPGSEFWVQAEEIINTKFDKINTNDLCSIILAYIYVGEYPLKVIKRIFSSEYLIKVNNPDVLRKLHLIDTALTLECKKYAGPLLPKDQWSKPVSQDHRVKNIIKKTFDTFVSLFGNDKISTEVLVPNLCSDDTYLLDVMIHPSGMGSNMFNWKSRSARNENIAVLVHLPDHYCSAGKQLIGPQIMKKKHIKILGMKVVSLQYSVLSQFYTSCNMSGLKQYISDNIDNAESCE